MQQRPNDIEYLKMIDVFARRGAKTIFTNLSLTMRKNSVNVIVGKNGCGKSTLLEVCSQNYTGQWGGLISLNGENIADVDPLEWRRRIGIVYQKSTLFSSMTIGENIVAGLELRRLGLPGRRPDYTKLIRQLLTDVGLWPELENDLNQRRMLSGGQTKRIALARTLAINPDVVIFDEPFAGVDEENVVIMERLIKHMVNRTVIVVTHDKDQARRLVEPNSANEPFREGGSSYFQMREGRISLKNAS